MQIDFLRIKNERYLMRQSPVERKSGSITDPYFILNKIRVSKIKFDYWWMSSKSPSENHVDLRKGANCEK